MNNAQKETYDAFMTGSYTRSSKNQLHFVEYGIKPNGEVFVVN